MDATTSQIYLEILEKTNSQLSLWYNPYGVMITILTLLIAIIAIGVSIALVRNSSEQKKQTREFFEDQRRSIKENIATHEAKLDELIEQYKKQLSGENKEEIQKVIDKLTLERASLGNYAVTGGVSSTIGLWNPALQQFQYQPTVYDLQQQVQALLQQVAELQRKSGERE